MINIIVAIARNKAIGYKNQLIYHLSNDLKRFKALTTGHTIIMGRKTFESLPKGALPNRRNIVLSRQKDIEFAGAEHFTAEHFCHFCIVQHKLCVGFEPFFPVAAFFCRKVYACAPGTVKTVDHRLEADLHSERFCQFDGMLDLGVSLCAFIM